MILVDTISPLEIKTDPWIILKKLEAYRAENTLYLYYKTGQLTLHREQNSGLSWATYEAH
jgi:hypothetical protein